MDVKQAANGRWPDILRALGVDEAYLSGRNGPCPMCGGKDRWRFTDYDQAGMWWCNQCGTGDGFKLLELYHGWGFREAKKAVGELIPEATFTEPQQDSEEKAKRSLNRLRQEAREVEQVPEVIRYLKNRGLIVPPGIEAHPNLPYYVDGDLIASYPAMLGKCVTKDGRPVTYHRTYIRDGKKAPVDSPRKMMRTARKTKGYAIRLWPADDVICIAEGIETAIACKMLFDVPAWSVISTNMMIDFEVPSGINYVIVCGDNDKSFAGQAAAYEKARRLNEKGIRAEVQIPPHTGDFNDVLELKGRFDAA